jgi:hypothetical protein
MAGRNHDQISSSCSEKTSGHRHAVIRRRGCVRARTLVAVTAVCILALTGVASAAAAQTYVVSGQEPERSLVKPSTFIAGSGAGGGVMWYKHVHWNHWGSQTATGQGLPTWNTCTPDCDSGSRRTEPATILLSAPRQHCRLWSETNSNFYRPPLTLFTKITAIIPGQRWASITAGTQSCQ